MDKTLIETNGFKTTKLPYCTWNIPQVMNNLTCTDTIDFKISLYHITIIRVPVYMLQAQMELRIISWTFLNGSQSLLAVFSNCNANRGFIFKSI